MQHVDRTTNAIPLYRVFLFGQMRLERVEAETTSSEPQYIPFVPACWDRQSPWRVLAYLLTCSGRQSYKDPLLDALWPDEAVERAQLALSIALSQVRHGLCDAQGHALLTPRKVDAQKLIRLAGQEQIWCDWHAFTDLLTQAQLAEEHGGDALSLWEKAYALSRDEFLLDERYQDWCRSVRERTEGDQRLCVLHLAACYGQQGRGTDEERLLRQFLSDHPRDEDILCRLLELLGQQGRSQEALRWYQRTVEALEEEEMEVMEQTKEMVKWLQTTPSSQNRPVLRDVTSIEEVRDHQSTSPGQQQRMLPVLDSDYLPTLGEKGPEALASFEELIKICCHLSEGNELKTAERILWACLPRVENIAKLSFECQQEAANITSQGYLLAASLAGHRNDLQTRHQFSEQALLYGKLAQDHNLQLGALRQISITFDYLERPDKVLQIYQQILPYLHRTSPLLQACIYAGVSGAYAQRKQKQEAFRFIRMAYESFPVHHENEPDFLNIMCRYSTLVFFDGLNYLELGQPREAEKVFAQIDGLQPKISIPARVRVELLNYQVETFIALKEVEKACLYIQSAANDAYGIGSEKRFAEAKKLFANMQELWPHEPRVKQLEEIFVC